MVGVFTATGSSASTLWRGADRGIYGPELSLVRSQFKASNADIAEHGRPIEEVEKTESTTVGSDPLAKATEVPAIDRERGLVTGDPYADARLDNAPLILPFEDFSVFPGPIP